MTSVQVLDSRTTLPNLLSIHPLSPGFSRLHCCTCVMEPFDLPTLDGLHLIPGLCDGILTGAEALY